MPMQPIETTLSREVANVASRLLVVIMVDDLIDQLFRTIFEYERITKCLFSFSLRKNPIIGIRILESKELRHFCHRGKISKPLVTHISVFTNKDILKALHYIFRQE